MRIFTSFMAVGIICLIASLIYDTTKFTPGHITSLFVVIGAFLGIFGFYDILMDKFGYGLGLPITSFGNSLVNAAYEGFQENGFYGLFQGMYLSTSAGISGTIILSFAMALISKPKD